MKALIIFYTYESGGNLASAKTTEFNGTLSGLTKICSRSKSGGGNMTVPHQVIILDQDNLRDPIEKKKSDFDDDFGK